MKNQENKVKTVTIKACGYCGELIEVHDDGKGTPRKFCCRHCRQQYKNRRRADRNDCGDGFANADPDCCVHSCDMPHGHDGITHHCRNCGCYFIKA